MFDNNNSNKSSAPTLFSSNPSQVPNLFSSNNKGLFSSNQNIFGGIFSGTNNKENNIFNNINNNINNQEDEEHCCVIINDEKTELSQIKESENESVSGTESAFKSRKDSQLNLHDNNFYEEKKDNEFLKPHDININNRNEQNINNNNHNHNYNLNNTHSHNLDFEDIVNLKFNLFPINI